MYAIRSYYELGCHILIRRVGSRDLESHVHEVQGIHGHPAGAVSLFDVSARRQLSAPVEYADVVEPQKTALEDVVALGVLAVHPPRKVQEQFVEDPLQEQDVSLSFHPFFEMIDLQGCPGMYRRIYIA